MDEILTMVVDWAVPFLCGGVLTGVTAYWKGKRQRESALEVGVQCLLRAEILRCNEQYTAKKCCPIYAKEALKRAYSAYHALGGNDVATRLYEAVLSLPGSAGNGKDA